MPFRSQLCMSVFTSSNGNRSAAFLNLLIAKNVGKKNLKYNATLLFQLKIITQQNLRLPGKLKTLTVEHFVFSKKVRTSTKKSRIGL